MENIIYRELKLKECEKIKEINPAQYIGKGWREINGKRQLISINFQDNDWPNGYENHYNLLKKTIISNGYAVGAFDEDKRLLGFATINREFFGSRYNYVLLDQIFISLEHRNKGIGRNLFMSCVDTARRWNADKIYICAGSAEETIAFYFNIGCKETEEVNMDLYKSDPRDFQLEFVL